MDSTIIDLPEETISHIFSFCPSPEDVVSHRGVCKHWSMAGASSTLWKSFYLRKWKYPFVEPNDWLRVFADAHAVASNIVRNMKKTTRINAHKGTVCCMGSLRNDTDDFYTAGKDFSIRIWDGQTLTPKLVLAGHSRGHYSHRSLVVMEDMMFSATSGPGVALFDLNSGQTKRQYEVIGSQSVDAKLYAIHVDPRKGRIVAGSSDRSVYMWDLETGTQLASQSVHSDAVWSLRGNDDNMLVSSDWAGHAIVWDADTLEPVHDLEVSRGVMVCDVNLTDSTLLTAANTVSSFDLRNPAKGNVICQARGSSLNLFKSFQPYCDGLACVPSSGDIPIIAPRTGQDLGKLPLFTNEIKSKAPLKVELFVSHKTHAIAYGADVMHVYDQKSHRACHRLTEEAPLAAVMDDFRVMTGNRDCSIAINDYRGRFM